MRILIDLGHPAHVHYFRNAIKILESKNHQILVTTRDKEVSLSLLDYYKIPYICTGKNKKSVFGKLFSIIRNDYQIFRSALKFKPDIYLSFSLPFPAHVGYLLGKPVIGFSDTENAKINFWITNSFTNVILVPNCFESNLGKKQIKFDGFMELCYLHPKYFMPDKSVFSYLGIDNEEKFVILRFVSWKASHDFGHQGISFENKKKIVQEFSKFVKVFISSEMELPAEFEKYKMNLPPHLMHSAIYYSSLLYGESATMASEAAVMGVPAIYLDNVGRGYTNEQQSKYNIVYNYTESLSDQNKSIDKGIEILKNTSGEFRNTGKKIVDDKIDCTAFMVWFIENYPKSFEIMKDNPDYQYEFK